MTAAVSLHDARPHLLDATSLWGPSGSISGVKRVLATKRDGLAALGWRHTLMAPGAQGAGLVDAGGLPLPAAEGYRCAVDRRAAAALIVQARPDVVEAADPWRLGWSVLDACDRLGVPSVASCHTHVPWVVQRMAGSGRLGRWAARQARRYLVRLYRQFDLVLAPSPSITQALQRWGVARAVHQPLGVDLHAFNPSARDPAARARLLAQLGLAPDTRVLLYAGRYAPEKRLQLLADAVALLGPGHVLLTVGAGPQPPRGAQVRRLPVEHDAHRLARLVANADAFVHAGDQETFGLAALEAMACGTPVVASAHAGLGDLVRGVGLTVDSRSPAVWAESMHACLRGANAVQVWDALERARAHDWPCVLEQWTGRYRRLVRGSARADRPAADFSRA